MGVAPYVLFCVGCHTHGRIGGCCQRKECEGAPLERLQSAGLPRADQGNGSRSGSIQPRRAGWAARVADR